MATHRLPATSQRSDGGVRSRDARSPSEACSCEGRGTCRSCAQRRKHAWRLVTVDGLSDNQAAKRMRLTPGRVRLLVAQECDRRDLQQYRLDMIAADRVRAFLEREQERNPDYTLAELAHYMNMKQIDLARQLGYEPGKNGRRQRKIGIEAASRLVIALGRAPHELDGC